MFSPSLRDTLAAAKVSWRLNDVAFFLFHEHNKIITIPSVLPFCAAVHDHGTKAGTAWYKKRGEKFTVYRWCDPRATTTRCIYAHVNRSINDVVNVDNVNLHRKTVWRNKIERKCVVQRKFMEFLMYATLINLCINSSNGCLWCTQCTSHQQHMPVYCVRRCNVRISNFKISWIANANAANESTLLEGEVNTYSLTHSHTSL